MKAASRLWLVAALAAALVSCTDTDTPIVLGASSTRVLNKDLEETVGKPLTFINAGSPTLVQQLIDGAPADVLITADAAAMEQAAPYVTDAREVARNELVMVVRADVETPNVVVACDPAVPCGAYTSRLTPASLEHSVADVLGKVTSGQADAGVVYRTDAQAAAGHQLRVEELADAPTTAVWAAAVKDSPHPEAAREILAALSDPALWARHGFQ